MNGSLRAAPAVLGLALAACTTPAPRIPFDTGRAAHALVVAGDWTVNKSFAQPDYALGLEVVLEAPGTAGWGYEAGVRYASGEGEGVITTKQDVGLVDENVHVTSEREIDFYEVSFGARQTYQRGSRLQPYFGVGGVVQQFRSIERYVQPIDNPTYPVETPIKDSDRSEILPGLYARTGLTWYLLRGRIGNHGELPLALDVRGVLGLEYSYLEFSLGFGFGRTR